jgi:hypothetical protein
MANPFFLRNLAVMTGLLCCLLLADIWSLRANHSVIGTESIASAAQDAAAPPVLAQASFEESRPYRNDLARASVRHLSVATIALRQPEPGPRSVRLAQPHGADHPAHSLLAQRVSLLI